MKHLGLALQAEDASSAMSLLDVNISKLKNISCSLDRVVYVRKLWMFVDGSFCPAQSCSHSVPKKYTKTYINYKLFSLLAQAYY